MTDAREIIAKAIEPFVHHADDVTSVVANTLTTAGYRILGPDEVDPVTLERAELASFHQQSKIYDRKRTEWDRGNDSAVNGCIHAIRALGRKA